jgi:hypothetical protein
MKKQSAIYCDGREVKAPRGITAAQLQIIHDAYYPAESVSAEDRALRAAQLLKAHEFVRQAEATEASNKARITQTVARDRRILEAHGKGVTPKQIQGDRKICGRKKLSLSQIYRILKAPRP